MKALSQCCHLLLQCLAQAVKVAPQFHFEAEHLQYRRFFLLFPRHKPFCPVHIRMYHKANNQGFQHFLRRHCANGSKKHILRPLSGRLILFQGRYIFAQYIRPDLCGTPAPCFRPVLPAYALFQARCCCAFYKGHSSLRRKERRIFCRLPPTDISAFLFPL